VNIALRDAIAAANHLVPVLQRDSPDPAAIDAATAALEVERSREIAVIQRLQALPPRFLLNEAWWGRWLRRLTAGALASGLARSIGPRPARAFLYGTQELELRV
jgi:2-polyprenyl-6-methoxyphenol hydroxylase-like FAD-dependent oxidoreductase